jgi:hypothetical protein
VDPDGDTATHTFARLLQGDSTPYATDEVPASALTQGATWTCVVEATDGVTPSSEAQASITVLTKTTFASTGVDQTWVVPAGATQVLLKAWGAAGGGSDAESTVYPGGAGGDAEGVLATTPGEPLTLLVGEGGPISSVTFTPAYPGGGAPGYRAGYLLLELGLAPSQLRLGHGIAREGWAHPQSRVRTFHPAP